MANKRLLDNTFTKLLDDITPYKLIEQQCHLKGSKLTIAQNDYDLEAYRNIYLLGSGKAVIPMAEAIHQLLQPHLKQSLIIGPYPYHAALEHTTYLQSSHPLPSKQSLHAAKALTEIMSSLSEDDLFIYLLSGGNSALVELPEASISLKEFQDATSMMLHGGMPIDAINTVRKHISKVKGGKLADITKARGIVLVLSDVIGNDLHAIGSAPLFYDTGTFDDAVQALEQYALLERMPQSIAAFLKEGVQGKHAETPKAPHSKIEHHILGSNTLVLQKAKKLLQESGIETTLHPEPIEGESTNIVQNMLRLAQKPCLQTHCHIFGGESTVVVSGKGKGGRNQHLCLSLLNQLDTDNEITFLSAATDGVDGNSDAAGALIDTHSKSAALSRHINPQYYLDTFDSNTFFSKTGELLIPGPTHNNLLDIAIMLIEPKITRGVTDG